MSGFFGKLKPYTGAYPPSVYAKYSRGGGTALGTLGKAFSYKRPAFDAGGAADDSSDPIAQIDAALASPQQQRQPSMGEQYLKFAQQWGGGPEGVNQRFSGGSPYDIARASDDLSQLDEDTREKVAKYAEKAQDEINDELASKEPGLNYARGGNAFVNFWNATKKIRRRGGKAVEDYARGGNVSQQLADRYLRQNIGGSGIHPTKDLPDYDEEPQNTASNDSHQAYTAPHSGDQLPLKSSHGSRGTGFARGGSTVKQRNRIGKGMHIAAPHSGEGLVMNIHLSNVGPHALSLTHSGGVNVERAASRALQSYGHPQPFHPMPASQLGLQGAPGGGFGQMLGQTHPHSTRRT